MPRLPFQPSQNVRRHSLLSTVLLGCVLASSCSDDLERENVKRLEAADLHIYGENYKGSYWRFESGGLYFHEDGTVLNILDKLALISHRNDVLVVRNLSSSSLTMVLTFSPDGATKFTDVYWEPEATEEQLAALNDKCGFAQTVSYIVKLPSMELSHA